MSEVARGENLTLTITLKNTKPVEVVDLGLESSSVGKTIRTFVHSHGYEKQAGNARLYVSEIETGSIIAKLQAILRLKEKLTGSVIRLQTNDQMLPCCEMPSPLDQECLIRQKSKTADFWPTVLISQELDPRFCGDDRWN